MIEIPRLNGGTCATCGWADKRGAPTYCNEPTWLADLMARAAGDEPEPAIRIEGDVTPAYSSFWGDWCQRWKASDAYVSPPPGVPVYPAFTTATDTLVFCPGCSSLIPIGPDKHGRLEHKHSAMHPDGGEYFADVVGPLTPLAKQIKRLGDKCGNAFWYNSHGPTTREYRFSSPSEANEEVEWLFTHHHSFDNTRLREVLRYLRLGEDYPFKWSYERQIKDGWTIGEGGRIISPVPGTPIRDRIVWLEDPTKYAYLRKADGWSGKSTAFPVGRWKEENDGRLIGYQLNTEARHRKGTYFKFWIYHLRPHDRDLDPEGVYAGPAAFDGGMPSEAVDPRELVKEHPYPAA